MLILDHHRTYLTEAVVAWGEPAEPTGGAAELLEVEGEPLGLVLDIGTWAEGCLDGRLHYLPTTARLDLWVAHG